MKKHNIRLRRMIPLTLRENMRSQNSSVRSACFSFEADVVGIVQAADEPYNLFSPCLRTFILRPLIGIITKTDSPYANVPMIKQWLLNAGCDRIFLVNNVTREGIDELMEYLAEDPVKITMEQAKFKQHLGLNEWGSSAGWRRISGWNLNKFQ